METPNSIKTQKPQMPNNLSGTELQFELSLDPVFLISPPRRLKHLHQSSTSLKKTSLAGAPAIRRKQQHSKSQTNRKWNELEFGLWVIAQTRGDNEEKSIEEQVEGRMKKKKKSCRGNREWKRGKETEQQIYTTLILQSAFENSGE